MNSLRDVGTKHVRTSHVIVSDIDLEPSGPMEAIKREIADAMADPELHVSGGTPLFILPTFMGSKDQEHGVPLDKAWVQRQVQAGKVTPANLCQCYDCHSPTKFARCVCPTHQWPSRYFSPRTPRLGRKVVPHHKSVQGRVPLVL